MKKIHPFKIEVVRRGLNQLDLAEAAHMNPSRLNRILNGRVEPQEYELKNLRQALGLKREVAA
jgi:transcriptional regulator with XRE-family HTH domain